MGWTLCSVNASAVVADAPDDCKEIWFPNVIDALLDSQRMSAAIQDLHEDPVELDSRQKREAWVRWESFNRWKLVVADARLAIARGDDAIVAEAFGRLADMVTNHAAPDTGWYDVLALYVENVDPHLPPVPRSLVAWGATVLRSRGDSPPLEPLRSRIVRIALARLAVEGESPESHEFVDENVAGSGIAGQFELGYIDYLINSNTLDEAGLRRAIDRLTRLSVSDRIEECNPTLLGVSLLLAADAHLLLSDIVRKRYRLAIADPEVVAELSQARAAVETARRSLDPVYVPGLWAYAHGKSADVYTQLMSAHADDLDARETYRRYSALADQSRRLSSLY